MYCNGLVRKSRTIATIAAIASIATWLDAFASSAILLFVGLPLTTKVLLRPGGDARDAEADDVGVLLEVLLVLDRVGP